MANLSAYRAALNLITLDLIKAILEILAALWDSDDREGMNRKAAPLLTREVRIAREKAYEEAVNFLTQVAKDNGIEDPYIPNLRDYSQQSVETVLSNAKGSYEDVAAEVGARLDRHVEDTARQVIIRAAEDQDVPEEALPDDLAVQARREEDFAVGWARVPTGTKTCGFCIMLCSRGAVYHSRASAGAVAKLSEDGELLGWTNRFHTNCDCVAVPVYKIGGDYPGKERVQEALEIYSRAYSQWEKTGLSIPHLIEKELKENPDAFPALDAA